MLSSAMVDEKCIRDDDIVEQIEQNTVNAVLRGTENGVRLDLSVFKKRNEFIC